jgi:diguanylate cyclase (GGDEF)-like protein
MSNLAGAPPVDHERGQTPIAKDRLLNSLRTWSGQHAQRPVRVIRRKPAMLRIIASLVLLLVVALSVCAALSYLLAWQSDNELEAAQRQSLLGAVEALRVVTPDAIKPDPKLLPVLERTSGLKGLRFEREPSADDRVVQSVLGRNGRIVGWFSWEPARPATRMIQRLLPLAGLIAVTLFGLAVLVVWDFRRLGRSLSKSEQRIRRLEYEDILTGLPNHNRLAGVFDEALAARKGDETLAFLSIDLDGFDEVNDSLGYASGDEVLVEIGRRLREAVPPSAVIGRLGSDEFALLIPGMDPEAILQLAHCIREAVARPIWANQAVHVTCSIGIAMAPSDGTTREDITRRAQLALRAAKRRGHGSALAFAIEMEADLQERRFIKREVARALAARAFDLHYQPIINADTGAIGGIEALLRWNHATRGAIPPSVFIPVAEKAGLMDRLGEFVLRRAIADAARWPDLYLSVNLSPLQVRDPRFVDVVASVLADSGFKPARLVLEITEGVLIDDPDQTRARLLELRALGVRLALDDFGSGYSSLSYLQQLPIDKLKIDRSFVASLDQSANGGVIIQAIVTLGRALGMDVVIEGVETEQQRVLLRLAGCNEMQGYLFAKPAVADDIDRLLSKAKFSFGNPHGVSRPLVSATG